MNRQLWFLCGFALLLWASGAMAQTIELGKPTKDMFEVIACDKDEQIMDILTSAQKDPKLFSIRFQFWNNQPNPEGNPSCGFTQSQILVTQVMRSVTLVGKEVFVIEYHVPNHPAPLYGLTTYKVRDAKSI